MGRALRTPATLEASTAPRWWSAAGGAHLHAGVLALGSGYADRHGAPRRVASHLRHTPSLDGRAVLQPVSRVPVLRLGTRPRPLATAGTHHSARFLEGRVTAAGYDAIIVGSGPNGLAAAIVLARNGLRVMVYEAADEPGGGMRTEPLTLPGFAHDVCSAVHPLGIGSPFFRSLPLGKHGLTWVQPPAAVAHPFEDGTVALLERSTAAMDQHLGTDAAAWRALMDPFVSRWQQLFGDALGPLKVPRHPILLARFGIAAFPAATWLARGLFRHAPARALFGGIAAHATVPLRSPPSAAFGMILGVAGHAVGWPIPRGGSASITRALVSHYCSLGGELTTNRLVESLDDLPSARAVLLDLTPRQILRLHATHLSTVYRAQLERFQYGLGTFKIDWALDQPIPWRARESARAATVHLGGTLEEIDSNRQQEWAGQPAERPYVLVVQPSLFDGTRAPAGKHVAWAYCHVPNGSTFDMTDRIEAQVERFAPGFRNRIVARHTMAPADLERHNPNLVGGDLNGGEASLAQLFFRPALRPIPYATSNPGLFVCSSSSPPGGGVHGMAGYYAARLVLRRIRARHLR
ncbi:MAG: NAD(P)/FAD-dependent oxidoreductase [Chloroflexi bacterium]|nr:NAD(P)/FAD-dependent oxidoreductase [Chloroflexota bacterium]